MANLTDPLVRAVQGSDPQNLMEYITRQRIYDSRFWKEECFGLTVADVLEKAAKTVQCIGGTFGANQKPTKFLCLVLKLLQLQPDTETIIDDFIRQDYFKYVKILGAFYLRLTGRPADIYESLEPLYKEYNKLKVRRQNEWELLHTDEVVHSLLHDAYFVGITLPRLPARETLQQEGFLDEGPRETSLNWSGHDSIETYLKYRARVEGNPQFLALFNKRYGKSKSAPTIDSSSQDKLNDGSTQPLHATEEEMAERQEMLSSTSKRKAEDKSSLKHGDAEEEHSRKKKKKKKDKGFGLLFKKDKSEGKKSKVSKEDPSAGAPEEGSEEYWNEQRAKLGLKPLKK